jgi:hypothetical protein
MQDDAPGLPVKKVLVWSFLGCGGLLIVVAAAAGFAIWRIKASIDDGKPDVLALTDKFTDCFYRGDVTCAKSMTAWDEAVLSSLPAMASRFRERLGARGRAIPVDDSWSMHTFKHVTGATTTTILVVLNVAYTNDAHAVEMFELVDDGHGLRIRNFHVNPRKTPIGRQLLARRLLDPPVRALTAALLILCRDLSLALPP